VKTKVKDITIAEVRRICNGHLFCKDCSLYVKEEELRRHRVCILDVPGKIFDWMLDEEIEIPEEA
jgi:hypothetical protein